ncbi:MAG: hypothetical protein ACI89U_001804 [Gammaproteobacteria bacterium]|jgi:hypothetical protein
METKEMFANGYKGDICVGQSAIFFRETFFCGEF